MDLWGIGAGIQSADIARSNLWRVQEARHAERFSERMSSTAYQRSMQDMRAAGLNPILAYSQGGASSPAGVPAQIGDSQVGEVISSAMQMRRFDRDMKLLESQIYNVQEDTLKKATEREKVLDEALWIRAQKDQTNINSALMTYGLAKAKNLSRAEADIGPFAAYIDRLLQTIGLGTQSIPK